MHSQLNHLAAMQRSSELRRAAERARLAQNDRVTDGAGRQGLLAARTIVRLRRLGARGARLRVRRA